MATTVKAKKVNKKKVVDTKIKVGDLVKWTSHSGGYSKTKTGTVVVVMKPNTDYTYLDGIAQKFFIDALFDGEYGNRTMCRDAIKKFGYRARAIDLRYKVMFRTMEGMYRTTPHYLIEVPTSSGRGKSWLYHPRDGQKFTVITQN